MTKIATSERSRIINAFFPQGVHREFMLENGKKYEGQWLNDNMHGQGIYEWSDGKKYEGSFVDDKKHGFGIVTFPDGRRFEGGWARGKPHGKGTRYYPDGRVEIDEFKDGEIMKPEKDD